MAIKFNVQLLGLKEIEERLAKIRDGTEAQRVAAAQVFKDANQIMAASQLLCPVLTGNLRATGHVRIPVLRGTNRADCEFGYGGPAAPYALYVHEDLRKRHTNGQAKFLEIPYLQYVGGSLASFSTALRAAGIFGRSTRAR